MEKNDKNAMVSRILSYINEHQYKIGDKLPSETELAQEFGVSRVAIREGMQGLKFLGILQASTKRGTVICEMDFALLTRGLQFQLSVSRFSRAELTAARQAIELGAIELICGKLSDEFRTKLIAAADCACENNSREERERNCLRDSTFHHLLLEASGNVIFQAYGKLLDCFFPVTEIPAERLRTATRAATDEHLQLIAALEQNQLELARGIIRYHLGKTIQGEHSC